MATRLFGVKSQDRRNVAAAFVMLLLVMSGHAILETARDALFLATLPPTMLPWAYLAMAALALAAAALNRKAMARFSRRRALSLTLLGGAAVTASFWFLSSLRQSPGPLLALYVWTGLLATVVLVQFWLGLAEVLDVSQAKRVFGVIGAGGLVGAMLGSGIAAALLMVIPPSSLVLAASGFFVAAAVVPAAMSRPPRKARESVGPRRGLGASSELRELSRDPYLRRLLIIVLLSTLVITGGDFVFKAAVVREIPAGELGTFFARFYGALNALGLVIQLVVVPRLLRGAGVNRTLLIMPALLFCASVSFALSGGLIAALFLRGTDGAMRHSIDRIGTEILYLPLARDARDRFKSIVESAGRRGGQAIASLLILAAVTLGASAAEIATALVILSAAWIIAILGLRPHYVNLFRRRLREGTIETRAEVPDLDLHSLEAMVSALSSEDDVEVIAALDMFATYDRTKLVPALIVFHPSGPVVLRALELFGEAGRADAAPLARRLLRHPDREIRAAALCFYAGAARDEAALRRCLTDESPAVRAAATVGLIAAGALADGAARQELRAVVDGPSAEAREALALALRHLPADRFAWVAADLVKLAEPGLAATVARSLAAVPSARHLPTLVDLLAHRQSRAAAREALSALGEVALEHLEKAMDDTSLPRAVRRHVPRTISRFSGQRPARILLRRLIAETDEAIHYKVLRGLGRLRANDPSAPIDRDALLGMAEVALDAAVTARRYRRLVDGARRRGADTPAAELLASLLGDQEASAMERAFRFLHIIRPTEEFEMIYDGLRSSDSSTRASSRELLEHVVPDPLHDRIVAMIDDANETDAPNSALADPSREYHTCLLAMSQEPSELLRSVVARHLAELGGAGARDGAPPARSSDLPHEDPGAAPPVLPPRGDQEVCPASGS